jgi:uncharacterized protein (TIGR02147 family)
MKKDQVFDHKSYREYLHESLGRPGQRTGMRLRACKALGCHTTYLSQVLSGRAHLSLEHAESLNRFLEHTKEESEFFLTLVLRERAGTKPLQERFSARIQELLAKRNIIKNRVKAATELSPQDQDRFYGSWLYTAIHVLVSIPDYQTLEKLAAALGISLGATKEALEFLRRIGVVVRREGRYVHGPQVLHLGSDSLLIAKHHSNWRFHAIQSLGRAQPDDLHYSAAVSLTKEVAQKVRDNILRTLQDNIELIKHAKEEEAYVYSFDFYRLA